jgi:pimeloyl-ACP methyl ester carboxylesterase
VRSNRKGWLALGAISLMLSRIGPAAAEVDRALTLLSNTAEAATRQGVSEKKRIDSLESLEINGVKQWVQIQGNDPGRPVLLVLHGGPGYAMLPLFHEYNSALEDDFVVVNWDQRGAGRSYASTIPAKSMTMKQILADLKELVAHLKKRFKKEKVWLLGHSWGTMFGLQAVKDRPEDYAGYIGVGQVVGAPANEIKLYEWALEQAKKAKHKKATTELEKIGHPDAEGLYKGKASNAEEPYQTSERWMAYFGGELKGKQSSGEIDEWILKQPAYSGKWGAKWKEGVEFSNKFFDDPAVFKLDHKKNITSVEVPVYFLQGRDDWSTPSPLVADYAKTIKAPVVKLVWFEKSAHFPFYEESATFNKAMHELAR